MNNVIPFPTDAVTEKDGKPITTSLRIADVFGKYHRDVLRSIRDLDCSDEFRLRNFAQSTYVNEQGKPQPMTEITKNGFVFLVMGYTGAKAAQFKEAYIARFDAMEQQLKEQWLASQLDPLFDDTGLPLSRLETDKAMRRQMRELQALLFDRDPVTRKIRRYKVAGLNNAEIGKLLGLNRSTVSRLVKRMAAAGMFRFSGQIVPGQSSRKAYPKTNVSPNVVTPLPKRGRSSNAPLPEPQQEKDVQNDDVHKTDDLFGGDA